MDRVKEAEMTSKLDALKELSIVVADTGDPDAVKEHKPQDCTTNPSLVLAALQTPAYEDIVGEAIGKAKDSGATPEELAQDLTVAVGAGLTEIVPGRVSTEVDARLSFDTGASVDKARALIEAYESRGVTRDRILIKLASTWEGVRAAEILQKEGIDCNMTLIFSLAQAVAAADAGAFLISPFVGRITDWYKASEGVDSYAPDDDPGVKSVRQIYDYYKSNGIGTIVMGASFRNTDQILALAGCDRLTISPKLLSELSDATGDVPRRLSKDSASGMGKIEMDEATFRWELNEDPMATEKLSEGIRKFHADTVKLHGILAEKLG